MSFLDSLENNLKALESQEPGGLDDSRGRRQDRANALAAAPWAEKLKNGQYVRTLMRDATRAGSARRMKVNLVWIGTTLRLEALDQRLELQPTANGVDAVLADRRVPVDLSGEPESLIREWMEIVDRRKREQEMVPVEFEEE